jgi:hypothetical protein
MPRIFMNSGPGQSPWNRALGRFSYGRIWSILIDLMKLTYFSILQTARSFCRAIWSNMPRISRRSRKRTGHKQHRINSRLANSFYNSASHHKYSFSLQHRAKKLGHNLVSAVSKLGHTWHVPYSEGPRSSDYYNSYLCRLRASLRLVLETFRRLLELAPCNHLLQQHPLAPIPAY